MNLLDETKGEISQSGHSTDDVRFVGSRDGKLGIPWSQAEKVLDIDYDDGYGGQEIAADLVVVFTDGGVNRTGCKHFDLHNPGQKEMDLEH